MPSPRDLRKQVVGGTVIPDTRNVPTPPQEWTKDRRRRLLIAARAAQLFVVKGLRWRQIAAQLEKDFPGEEKTEVSRQRIQQYVKKGCDFLVDRDWFQRREVK